MRHPKAWIPIYHPLRRGRPSFNTVRPTQNKRYRDQAQGHHKVTRLAKDPNRILPNPKAKASGREGPRKVARRRQEDFKDHSSRTREGPGKAQESRRRQHGVRKLHKA